MDDLFLALSYFRRRKFEQSIEVCNRLLSVNAYDQAAWVLKMKALTEQVYLDDTEPDEQGLAEALMDDNSIAQVSRPGTSLRAPKTGQSSHVQAFRPMSISGRPMTGVLHPGTSSGRPTTMEQAMNAPRTAHTARPMTSASGRFMRLGTATMVSSPDGPFINLARLNISKYASNPTLAKPLFQYIFYHENDVRTALNLAAEATQKSQFKDWWWKVQLAKCYYRLGLFRDCEKQLLSALLQHKAIETYLHLAKVCIRMDQPLTAVEVYNGALQLFPGETTILTGIARIHEGLNDMQASVNFYKSVLQYDATNVEAIACLATNHFYSDQPEVAMRFYRRLLQMGVYNSEVFTNLGLCCFYAQQFDLTLTCFERALALANEEAKADIWYNISHVALSIGDMSLAYQCLRLALVLDNNHAEAYSNLAILECRNGQINQAKAFFQASGKLGEHLYEPFFNSSLLSEKVGDIQSSYNMAQKSLEVFPAHTDSKALLQRLKHNLAGL